MKHQSKISNTEWGLIIGALFAIDLVQIGIDWLTVGISLITINPLIDIFVGISLPFYLKMRGEKLASQKKIFGFIVSAFLKFIPGVDEFPLWGLDGIAQMLLSKAEETLEMLPGGKILNLTEK